MSNQTAVNLQAKTVSPSMGRLVLRALRDALAMRRLVQEDRPVSASTMQKVRDIALHQ